MAWTTEKQPFGANHAPLLTGLASDGSGPVPVAVDSATGALLTAGSAATAVAISDGVTSSIKATVASLTNAKALAVEIVDGSGNQITSFGGGTQYANGAVQATPTGTVALGYDGANVRALSTTTGGVLKIDLSTTSANATAIKVDGSAVTQPISAAALPLPSGAATAAKQPALGTAGAASADVITVQGIASMTALKVDGSSVTQPVSGSVTANIGTTNGLALDATLTGGTQKTKLVDSGGTNVATISAAGAVKVDGSAVTQPVSLTSTTITGTVAVTESGTWNVGTTAATVKVGQTTSAATAVQLSASSTPSTNGILVQAISTNTASVFIGDATVTTSSGFELQPGQAVPFTASNITALYVIGSNTSDKVCWNVM